nr:hypothetical protein [Bacteroidota bacterium]
MKNTAAYLALTLLIILTLSCKKEDQINSFQLENTKLTFDYDVSIQNFTIGNIGDKDINWEISSQDECFYFNKNYGTLMPDVFETIYISLKRDKILGDSIKSQITFNTSDGDTEALEVLILNFPEKKYRLMSGISTAAFSKETNMLYISPVYGNHIEIFDVTERTFDRFPLNSLNEPIFEILEVSPDGKYLIASLINKFY